MALRLTLHLRDTLPSSATLNDEVLEQSLANIKSALNLFVEEELISQEQAENAVDRTTTTTDLTEVARDSDFITEAIVEKSQDKRELFNKLDELCPRHTILASNTSGLVLSDFGSDVARQDKLVITHYFTPPHIVPGVEVAKGPGTSDETYDITCDLMETREENTDSASQRIAGLSAQPVTGRNESRGAAIMG